MINPCLYTLEKRLGDKKNSHLLTMYCVSGFLFIIIILFKLYNLQKISHDCCERPLRLNTQQMSTERFILDPGDTAGNKTKFLPHGVDILAEERDNKQSHMYSVRW